MDMWSGSCEHGKDFSVTEREVYFLAPCVECEGRLARISPAAHERVARTVLRNIREAWGEGSLSTVGALATVG